MSPRLNSNRDLLFVKQATGGEKQTYWMKCEVQVNVVQRSLRWTQYLSHTSSPPDPHAEVLASPLNSWTSRSTCKGDATWSLFAKNGEKELLQKSMVYWTVSSKHVDIGQGLFGKHLFPCIHGGEWINVDWWNSPTLLPLFPCCKATRTLACSCAQHCSSGRVERIRPRRLHGTKATSTSWVEVSGSTSWLGTSARVCLW